MESQQQQHYSATGAGSNKNIGHYSQTLTYLLGELKHVYDQRGKYIILVANFVCYS